MDKNILLLNIWNLFTLMLIFYHIYIGICALILILNRFFFFKTKFQKYLLKINSFFLFFLIILVFLNFDLFNNIFFSLKEEINYAQKQKIPINFFFIQPSFIFNCEITYYFCTINFLLTKYSLLLWTLFSLLFPMIFFLLTHNYSYLNINFFCWIIIIFMLCYFLVAVDNIISFVVIYILLITLFLYILYLSFDCQKNKKILMKYSGWAIISFISLIIGTYILISTTNQYKFSTIFLDYLTVFAAHRAYYFYFFCFGITLSFWPFWHWLFRIHTEVSIEILIFINCILIKIIYFCLFRFQLLFCCYIDFRYLILICVIYNFNLLFKLQYVKQLRSLITYISMIQTNWIILSMHIDYLKIVFSSILYIWCHSLIIASFFLCIYLLEKYHNTTDVSSSFDLFQNYYNFILPLLINTIYLLDLPLTLFFWYQFWSWSFLFNGFFFLIFICYIYINTNFIFIFIEIFYQFFTHNKPNNKLLNIPQFYKIIFILIIWLCFIQIITRPHPSILLSIIYYLINLM